MITGFVTDISDDCFRFLFCVVVHANKTVDFLTAEKGTFGPTNVIGDAVIQKCTLDEFLTFQVGYFTQFDFIIYFDRCI